MVPAPMSSGKHAPWWLWPSLLSLDAPLVAVVWLYMFARAWQVNYLAWPAYVALALGVWAIYVVDRLLDRKLRSPGDPLLGQRHDFHARHAKKFIVGVVLAVLGALLLVLGFLPAELLISYSGPAIGLVVAFFLLVTLSPMTGEVPFIRNLVAGLAFGYGTAMMAHIRVPSQGWVAMALSRETLGFAVLCALNITAIHLWEHSRMSDDPEVKAGDEMSLTLPLTLVAGGAFVFAYMDNPWMFGRGYPGEEPSARPFFYAILISAALLQILNRTRARFSIPALRTLADVAMIAPLPLFLIFARG